MNRKELAIRLYADLKNKALSLESTDGFADKVAGGVERETKRSAKRIICNDWRSTVTELCRKPAAAKLAIKWCYCEEGAVLWAWKHRKLIEPAAIASVAALEILVGRGIPVYLPRLGSEINETKDRAALRGLAKCGNDVGKIARKALGTTEPWNWYLLEEAKHWSLDDNEEFQLLAYLAKDGSCGVKRFQSELRTPLDRQRTQTSPMPAENDDGVWILLASDRQGISIGNSIRVREQAQISTLDSIVLLDPECPVGRWLRENVEDNVPLASLGWRARWGLFHPQRLREEFDEQTLRKWRHRMMSQINPAYQDKPKCQLSEVGQRGDRLKRSIMQTQGQELAGDAHVTDVLERDGVAQHGLGCPGGNPLLLAVVLAQPT